MQLGLGLGLGRYRGEINLFDIRKLITSFKQRILDDLGIFEAQKYLKNLLNKYLFTNANFILTPNGYKIGKLYTIEPTNGNLDFTFERNSTATRINSNGLIETVDANVPRIDYSTGEAKILIEGQSTEYNRYSNNLLDSSYIIGDDILEEVLEEGCIKDENYFKFTASGTSNIQHNFRVDIDEVEGQEYVISCFVKKGNSRYVGLGNRNATTYGSIFDLDLGIVDTEIRFHKGIITKLPNDWFKISTRVFLVDSANTLTTAFFLLYDENKNSSYVANGENAFVCGLNVYLGNEERSYIPTNGTIKTRVADNAYINNFTSKYSNRILNNKLSINYFSDFILPQQSTKYGFSFDDLIGVNTYDNFNINEVEYYDVDIDTTNFREGLKEDTTLSLFPSENNTVGSVRTLQDDSFDFDRNSTTTRVNKKGLIESVGVNKMRVDYSTGEGSILIEPQRTNLINYSDSTDSNYGGFGYTSELNDWGIGLNNKIVIPNSTSYRLDLLSEFSTGTHTLSFYVKKSDGTIPVIGQDFGIQIGGAVIVDGENGDINIGLFKNDIYKIWVSSNIDVGGTNNRLQVGNISIGLEFGGFQLEEGSYPTSYIPTNGTIQTRVRDRLIKENSESLIPQTEGSMFIETTLLNPTKISTVIMGFDNQTSDNIIRIDKFSNSFRFLLSVDGDIKIIDADIRNATNNELYKIIISYEPTRCKIFINGVLELDEIIDGTWSGQLNRIAFEEFNDKSKTEELINNFQIFNRVLTDQEAINLTTI